MNIKFISEFIDGEIPLDKLKIVSVEKPKYAEVNLCIKSNMNIPFAKIQLYDTDRFHDAEKSFKCAVALGKAIEEAFNNRQINNESR